MFLTIPLLQDAESSIANILEIRVVYAIEGGTIFEMKGNLRIHSKWTLQEAESALKTHYELLQAKDKGEIGDQSTTTKGHCPYCGQLNVAPQMHGPGRCIAASA